MPSRRGPTTRLEHHPHNRLSVGTPRSAGGPLRDSPADRGSRAGLTFLVAHRLTFKHALKLEHRLLVTLDWHIRDAPGRYQQYADALFEVASQHGGAAPMTAPVMLQDFATA